MFRRSHRGSVRMSVLIFCCCYTIANAEQGLRERVVEQMLPNGLKVLLLENHKVPLITFQVWYRVGSRHETERKTGLSHMLEHMMFKGTETIGPGEMANLIQARGGDLNALTSRDSTAYFATLHVADVDMAMALEADRMRHLLLREEDFRTERQVVIEERRLRVDDHPVHALWEQVEATAFQGSPYHGPVIGWMEDIEQLTLEDLRTHYQAYYQPANAFLVVVGDFRIPDLMPRIAQTFAPHPSGAPLPPEMRVNRPQTGERRVVVRHQAQFPFLLMAYHVPTLRDPDSYTLEVLASLLSAGKSSRLPRHLVHDQQLALATDARHSLISRNPGLFYVSAVVRADRAVSEVEAAIDREIARLQREPVSPRELAKAKNQLETAFTMSQDALFSQASLLAQYEIAGSWRHIDDYLPAIRQVAAEDIQRVVQRYLIPENRTVGILMPIEPSVGKPFLINYIQQAPHSR